MHFSWVLALFPLVLCLNPNWKDEHILLAEHVERKNNGMVSPEIYHGVKVHTKEGNIYILRIYSDVDSENIESGSEIDPRWKSSSSYFVPGDKTIIATLEKGYKGTEMGIKSFITFAIVKSTAKMEAYLKEP